MGESFPYFYPKLSLSVPTQPPDLLYSNSPGRIKDNTRHINPVISVYFQTTAYAKLEGNITHQKKALSTLTQVSSQLTHDWLVLTGDANRHSLEGRVERFLLRHSGDTICCISVKI